MGEFRLIGLVLCIVAAAFIVVPMLRTEGDGKRSNIGLGIAIAVAIPLAVFALYEIVGGSGQTTVEPEMAAVPKPKTERTVSAPPVSDLAEKLALRLENNPDDPEGWALLAQSYRHLGLQEKAQAAYARAVESGFDPSRLNNQMQQAVPAELTTNLTIAGELTLSEAAQAAVAATDTVFVIARAPGTGRIPIAVQRRPAADFPLRFELSDADVMMAGRSLAEFDQLEIFARVSKSGMAEASPGDLRTAAQTVAVRGGESVKLLIDAD